MKKNKKDTSPFFLIRGEVSGFQSVLLGTLPLLVILLIWNILTSGPTPENRFISPTILPSPLEVVQSFKQLWFDRELALNAVYSIKRVFLGFVVSILIALPLGILMGSFIRIKSMFNPIAIIGGYLPIPALVPLTLSWFGVGEFQKIMFLAIATFVYLLPLAVKCVEEVDDVYLNTAYTLGASKWQAVTKVLISLSLPEIYQSMRLAFGVGWAYIILAEIVDANKGLGYLILTSQRRGPREHIYLVLIAIVLIAFIFDKLWVWGGKLLFPYREQK